MSALVIVLHHKGNNGYRSLYNNKGALYQKVLRGLCVCDVVHVPVHDLWVWKRKHWMLYRCSAWLHNNIMSCFNVQLPCQKKMYTLGCVNGLLPLVVLLILTLVDPWHISAKKGGGDNYCVLYGIVCLL